MNVKIVSYNVNGCGNFRKRKKIFYRFKDMKADIMLIQEMHSTPQTEQLWKTQWGGQIVFAHGESNARGVAIMFRRNFNTQIMETVSDQEGRVLAIKTIINDQTMIVATIYAPNEDNPQFFVNAFALMQTLGNFPQYCFRH